MLTIFSVPKPFQGHIGIIQRNALQSWAHLNPPCEIILCGDESGTEQAAAEVKARYITNIVSNEYGTPLLDSAFDQAQKIANHRLICYVNADIILLSDFIPAVQRIRFPMFLAVGQRWDINLAEPWDFKPSDWEERLRRYVVDYGVRHPPAGSDYFVFPRDCAIGKLPPFAVGRPGWDNWMIFRARQLGIPVIDVTRVVTVIHQNHGYEHLPHGMEGAWKGPESRRNLELAGGFAHAFTLQDANRVLTPQGLKRPKLTIQRLLRYIDTLPVFHPRLRFIVECLRHLMHLARLARASYRKITKFFAIKQWQ
jgi:hypothetical protein